MYLDIADLRATLTGIRERSASGSRLVVLYHSPGWMLWLARVLVRFANEPLRSVFTVSQMRALLGDYGFEVTRDDGLPDLGARSSPEAARAVRGINHMRIVTADGPA